MTLLARADRLVARIAAFETTKALATEAEGLRTRAEQLRAAARELRRVRAQQAALRANGLEPERDGTSSPPLVARARELLGAFGADRKAILTVHPPLDHSFLRPIKSVCEKVDLACANAWQTSAGAILGPLPDDLLNVLERIADLAPEVRRIRALQHEGQGIVTGNPGSSAEAVAAELARLRTISTEKSEKWAQLSGGGIPAEVVSFLRRAAVREARLSEVTPGVVEWLTVRGLLNAFRVSPG
ncbi:hypothetical protein [Roseomonas indoligenes]|uniref:Uncharacterized protein n=1 Tax=Roseomonas indoligenes TaxID=2820811 RepID=A0A940N3U8_9PROT|nr:hypothetical protein [Pararoseomonas indoligenes]MBP0496275.1 hypothetical protein [Pararoseomonas indoligenes]